MTIVRPRTRISLNLCPSPSPSISKLSNKIVDDRGHFSRTAHKICSLGALEGGGKKITGRREKPSMVFLNLRQPQPRLIRSQTNTTGSLRPFIYLRAPVFKHTCQPFDETKPNIIIIIIITIVIKYRKICRIQSTNWIHVSYMFEYLCGDFRILSRKKKRITKVDDVCKRIHIPGFRLPCQ